MKYNKVYKEGRVNRSSSPAELQRRSSDSNLSREMDFLANEIEKLKGNTSGKLYTEEEFNSELIKAIEKELKGDLQVKVLTSKVKELENVIKLKDEIISSLKNRTVQVREVTESIVEQTLERPKIDTNIVIDPTEDKEMVSHIKVKEIVGESMTDKLKNLKAVLGK